MHALLCRCRALAFRSQETVGIDEQSIEGFKSLLVSTIARLRHEDERVTYTG